MENWQVEAREKLGKAYRDSIRQAAEEVIAGKLLYGANAKISTDEDARDKWMTQRNILKKRQAESNIPEELIEIVNKALMD